MKIIKQPVKSKLSREDVSAFGNKIYSNEGVIEVNISIVFSDGSVIGIHRDKDEDILDQQIEEYDEEEEED